MSDDPKFDALIDAIQRDEEAFLKDKTVTHFADGDVIITREQNPGICGLVVEGFVKSVTHVKFLSKRNERIFDIYDPHQWIGTESMITNTNFCTYTAIEYAKVVLIPTTQLMEEITPSLHMMITNQSTLTALFLNQCHHTNNENIKLRVLNVLLRLRTKIKNYEIPLKIQEIADMVGTNRSRVSAIFKELENEGFLTRGYKNYGITDWTQLRNLLESYRNDDSSD